MGSWCRPRSTATRCPSAGSSHRGSARRTCSPRRSRRRDGTHWRRRSWRRPRSSSNDAAQPVTGEPRIEVLADPEATSRAAAEALADALIDAVARRRRADWATTGGSTPVGIYRELSVAPLRDVVPWQAVNVWWGDDRYVPRDHPWSNALPLDEVLVSAAARGSLSGTGEYPIDVEEGLEPGVPLPVANIHAPRMGDAIGL